MLMIPTRLEIILKYIHLFYSGLYFLMLGALSFSSDPLLLSCKNDFHIITDSK